jgi:hypothetical protein
MSSIRGFLNKSSWVFLPLHVYIFGAPFRELLIWNAYNGCACFCTTVHAFFAA